MQFLLSLNDWFRNLNLRNKLAVQMAIMAAFLIFVSLVGFYISYKENQRLNLMYKDRLLSILWIEALNTNIRSNEANIYKLMMVANPAERNRIFDDIANHACDWEIYLNNYISRSIIHPIEKNQLKILIPEMNKYKAIRNRTILLIEGGKSREAFDYYFHNSHLMEDINRRFDVIIKYNSDMAEKEYLNSKKEAKIGYYILFGALLIALGLLIPLMLLIAKTIAKPIRELVSKMIQVANGNLDVGTMETKYKNEVGKLNESFNTMKDNLVSLINKEKHSREREERLRNLIVSSVSTLQIEMVLKNLVIETGKLFNAVRCYFVRYDEHNQNFMPIADYESYVCSLKYKNMAGLVFTMDELDPFVKILFEQRQPLIINDVEKIKIPESLRKIFEEYSIKSFIITPVFFQDSPIGLLMIDYNNTEKNFTQDDINLLSIIANHSATVIHQAQLFKDIQTAKHREELLRSIITTVRGTLDFQQTLKTISIEIARIFNAERVFLLQFPNMNNLSDWSFMFDYINSSKMVRYQDTKFDPSAGQYWGDFIFNRGQVLAVDDIQQSDIPESLKYNIETLGIRAITGAGIRSENDVWGSLSVCTSYPRHWTKDEIDLLSSVSDQVYLAIKQSELYSTTRQQAERSELIRKITNAIGSTLELQEVLDTICQETLNVFKADRASIENFPYKGNYSEWTVSSQFTSGPDILGVNDIDYPAKSKEYLGNKVIEQGRDIIADDIEKADLPDFYVDTHKKMNIKSYIVVPLGKWGSLAVSQVHNYRHWTRDDIQLLHTIADQAYIAIRQAELYLSTKEQAKRAELNQRIIGAIGESLDLNQVINIICSEILNTFNVDRVSIEIFIPETNYLQWQISGEAKSEADIIGVCDIDYSEESKNYMGTRLLDESKDIIADDLDKSDLPDYFIATQKKMKIKSLFVVPIKRGKDKTGVLVLSQVHDYRHWTQDDIQLLHTIADQAYIAIRQAGLYSKAEESASREALLRAINNEILTSKSLDDGIKRIMAETGKLFKIDRSVLRFYDPVKKSFSEVRGEYRINENIPSTLNTMIYPPEFDEYIIKEIFDKNEFLIINNLDDQKYPEKMREVLKGYGVKSAVIAPLIYGDSPIGTISFTDMQSARIWSEKDLELLRSLVQQVSIGIHLFSLNERLSRALENERDIRNIIFEGRKLTNHDELFTYVLNQIADIYNVGRIIYVHYREKHEIYIQLEVLKISSLESLLNTTILSTDQTGEILPKSFEQAIVIDDVNIQLKNRELIDFFLKYKIQAMMIYPRSRRITVEASNEIIAATIVCSSTPRKWTSDEIEIFKLIIDMTSAIYFETLQRAETEELRGTFLATLTHDLRSPLNAEQKVLEAIMSQKLGTNLSDFLEYLNDIYKTNQELLRIVNNILSVYHYESGKLELNQETNDINEIINEVIRSLRPLAQEKNTDINIVTEGGILSALVDRNEINRVISNLVGNAIKHNQPNTDITIKSRPVGNEIEVSVSDSGKGISPEDRPKIFQRFPTEKRKVGTGLGLYISKQIVEAHGGRIWFESEVGKGTTFYFTVPAA